MAEQTRIETRLAQVERIGPDVVEVRYKEDVDFDTAGIAEVIAACEKLPLSDAFAIISMLPEQGGMDLQAMQQDHSTEGLSQRVKASAIVMNGELFRRLTEIHYTYHPQHYEVRIFSEVNEALVWVRACLDDATRT